jgi:hypothetical protein
MLGGRSTCLGTAGPETSADRRHRSGGGQFTHEVLFEACVIASGQFLISSTALAGGAPGAVFANTNAPAAARWTRSDARDAITARRAHARSVARGHPAGLAGLAAY